MVQVNHATSNYLLWNTDKLNKHDCDMMIRIIDSFWLCHIHEMIVVLFRFKHSLEQHCLSMT